MRPSPPFISLNLLRIQNVLRKTPHIQATIDPATSSNPNYIHSDYLMRALLIIDDKGIFPDEAVDLEIASWLRAEAEENQVDKMIFDYVKILENLQLLDPVYLTLHRLSGKSVMQCQKRYAILVFLTLFSNNNELSLMLKPLEIWTIFVKITNVAFLDQLYKINIKALVFFSESLDREAVFRELCISPIIDDVCLDILLFTFSQLEKYGEFTINSVEKLFKRMIEFTKDPRVKTINEMRGMISHHCLLSVAQLSFWKPGPEFLEKIKKYSQAAYVFFQSGYSLSALMAIPSDKQDKLLKAFHETAFVQSLVQNDIDPSEFLEFNEPFSKLISHFSTIATINHNLISKNKVNWILKILNFKAFQTMKDICICFEHVFVSGKAIISEINMNIFFDESFFMKLVETLNILTSVYGHWMAIDVEKLRTIFNFHEMNRVCQNGNNMLSYIIKILNQFQSVNDLTIEIVDRFLERLRQESALGFEFSNQFLINFQGEIFEFSLNKISDEIQEKMMEKSEDFYLLCAHTPLSLSRFSLFDAELQCLLLDYANQVIFFNQCYDFSLDQLVSLYEKNQPAFYDLVSSEDMRAFDSKVAHARMIIGISQPDIVRPSQSGMFSSSSEASDDGSTDCVCRFP